MITINFFAGAALLFAAATPAVAAADPRVEPVVAPAPAPTSAPTASVPEAGRRYCFKTEATGTRLLTKICQTRAAWREDGVNVDEHLKR